MVSIKKVSTDEELKEVAELAESIWHEFFPSILSEEQINYMVEKFQSYDAMKNQINSQNYYYLAVRNDDDLCGYIALKPENDS